jgi:hypothetical protein
MEFHRFAGPLADGPKDVLLDDPAAEDIDTPLDLPSVVDELANGHQQRSPTVGSAERSCALGRAPNVSRQVRPRRTAAPSPASNVECWVTA